MLDIVFVHLCKPTEECTEDFLAIVACSDSYVSAFFRENFPFGKVLKMLNLA